MNTEKTLVPIRRFPEFQNEGEWVEKRFGDCLDYEQPQPYLVASDNYKKAGTPVLTAGKTFVLGYTDEITGIYNRLPVIIFDDFTTASKFVDFPFKAKSSAMKMLQNRIGYDLRFMFEAILKYKFEPKDHQRHWISIFSQFKTLVPSCSEQQKIAKCLSSIDSCISSINEKIEQLKAHKKSLMQKMFPQNGKTVPEYRFPEFKRAGVWEEIMLGDVFSRITERNKKNNQNVLTISAQYGLVNQYDYFHKNIAASDISNYYLIQNRDFAYNKSRSQGYPFGVIRSLRLYDEGVVSTLYICFRIKSDKYSVDFFDQYFETELINYEIGKIAQEGARNHGLLNISTDDFFNKVVLMVPSSSEQQKIAECLSSIDKAIIYYSQKASLLEQQKKGLIQQLFPKQ